MPPASAGDAPSTRLAWPGRPSGELASGGTSSYRTVYHFVMLSAMRSFWPVAVLVLVALPGCPTTEIWEPPGDGVAKGCRDAVQFDGPIADRLGLSTHLDWGEDLISTAKREFEASLWPDLGVRVARRDLTWATLEPEKGVFDLAPADRVVDTAEGAGAEVLGLLVYGNSWAREDTDDTCAPPLDVTDFGDYAAELAERYAGRIRRYEVWNEPNVGLRFWKPEEDPVAYAALLEEASARIREQDPEAQVALGGLFHPDLGLNTGGPEFLGAVGEALPDLGATVDAVGYHPYRYPFTAPESVEDHQAPLADCLCQLEDQLAAMGAAETPLWITEIGWHTAGQALLAGADEDDHAAYTVRAALLSFAQGAELYLWYTFRDSGTDEEDQEEMFGLFRYDEDPTDDEPAEPKPAADAFATLAAVLGDHDRIEDLSPWLGLDADTYAYQLSGGGDATALALWSVGGPRTVRVPGDGAATLVPMTGCAAPLDSSGGAFELVVDSLPVYLIRP